MQQDYEFWLSQGSSLAASRDYAEALSAYHRALAVHLEGHKSQYQQRTQVWQALITLNLEAADWQVWMQHGLLLNQVGDYEQASASFAQALQSQPDCTEALCLQACSFLGMAALWTPDTGFKLKEQKQRRGLSVEAQQNVVKAVTNYCEVLKIASAHLEAENYLEAIVSALQNTEIVALCQAGLEIVPSDDAYHADLKHRSIDEALVFYHQLHASLSEAGVLQPNGRHRYYSWSVKGLYNRAVILQTLGSLEAAIAAYVELAVYFPWVTEASRAWYNRGIALESLQRSQEALASYKQALKLVPLYPAAWYRQGMMLNQLGNVDEANVSHKTALCLSQVFKNQSIAVLAVEALH